MVPEDGLRHKSYPLKTMAHPSFFLVLEMQKLKERKRKKKRVKQAKNIFHKLLTSCYLLLAMEDLSIATIYSNDSSLWRGT